MSKAAKTDLATPTVLAFERKLDPSDAQLFACRWPERDRANVAEPIVLREKSVRGTISNRLKAKEQDPAKLDAAIEHPNLQTVDVATLPPSFDTLKCVFTLRVLPGTGAPSACNNVDYRAKLLQTVEQYVKANGFSELSRRYAYNLASARFLWRNRLGAEQVEVRVERLVAGEVSRSWVFDSLLLSLRDFSGPATSESALNELASAFDAALRGTEHLLLRVTAFARLGDAQEAYPSQELILDKKSNKSRTLYHVNGVASIHSQKIGNALRTIDTWYSDAVEYGPIAIEPYGSVTSLGKACRRPGDKRDFYSLLDAWMISNVSPSLEQQHYVLATLIRGGVFGESGKE